MNNPPSSQTTITTGHLFNVSPLRAKRWHVNRSRIPLESPIIITTKTHRQCNYARTISRSPTCDQSITRSRERMSIERCGSHEQPFCVTTFRVTMFVSPIHYEKSFCAAQPKNRECCSQGNQPHVNAISGDTTHDHHTIGIVLRTSFHDT